MTEEDEQSRRGTKTTVGFFLTFGSREEKVVGAVHTQNCFTVSLGHVDALQRRRTTALGGRHRVNDAPGK